MSTFSVADIPDMTGKTVIVTGGSSGIGLATAHALAGAGAHVVLAVRNIEKGRAVATATPGVTEVRELNLASLDSVRVFAAGWDGRIDLLINNAGVSESKLSRTADGFELTLGTNHLGHFALTNLLLPHITGRVVTVASQAERFARIDFDDLNWEHKPYRQSPAYAQTTSTGSTSPTDSLLPMRNRNWRTCCSPRSCNVGWTPQGRACWRWRRIPASSQRTSTTTLVAAHLVCPRS